MQTVIAVEDLRKTYQPKTRKAPEVKALDGISFGVPRGEFFGLLGPNGAGKTTTIGILTTRVLPTGGSATIEGIDVARDPVAVKRRIGVVPQMNNLDRSLTARKRSVPGGYLIELQVRSEDGAAQSFASGLSSFPGVVEVKPEKDRVRIYADRAEGLLANTMRLASDQGVMVTDAHVAEPSLENLFLHLTGRSLRE